MLAFWHCRYGGRTHLKCEIQLRTVDLVIERITSGRESKDQPIDHQPFSNLHVLAFFLFNKRRWEIR